MTDHPNEPAPQTVALKLMQGQHVTASELRKEFRIGDHAAARLLERAQEIRTGWMLLKFARPARRRSCGDE
ncbi:MAG: hypothetical protein ACLFQ2_13230 [Wenzhouxiangella sp.]